jgi:pSer/pThr/pTyr-binding forkhead associated (FHA) protein
MVPGAGEAGGDEPAAGAPAARSAGEVRARLIAERSGQPFLVYRDGGGEQRLVALDDPERSLTIGRSGEADVAIAWDAEVSRLHAQLDCAAGEWVVVDDGLSSNGTFVNGARIASRRRLVDGDLIRVGATVLVFRGSRRGPPPTLRAGMSVTAEQLSDTQHKVLQALCRPYSGAAHLASPASNRQIAAELYLSLDAVKANLRAMYQLFDVGGLPQNQKRAQLAERAIAWGLVRPEA